MPARSMIIYFFLWAEKRLFFHGTPPPNNQGAGGDKENPARLDACVSPLFPFDDGRPAETTAGSSALFEQLKDRLFFRCRKILLFSCFRTIKPNRGGYVVSIQGDMERVWQAIRLFFSRIVARETIWSVGASPAAVVLQTVPLQAARIAGSSLAARCSPRGRLPGSWQPPICYPTNMSCFSDIFPERVKRHVVTTTAWSFYGKKVPPFV